MKLRPSRERPVPRTSSGAPSAAFVADGYKRLVSSVESEMQRIVEAKYADEWNVSGLMRRWQLQRRIDAELATLVAESMRDVSPEALF